VLFISNVLSSKFKLSGNRLLTFFLTFVISLQILATLKSQSGLQPFQNEFSDLGFMAVTKGVVFQRCKTTEPILLKII